MLTTVWICSSNRQHKRERAWKSQEARKMPIICCTHEEILACSFYSMHIHEKTLTYPVSRPPWHITASQEASRRAFQQGKQSITAGLEGHAHWARNSHIFAGKLVTIFDNFFFAFYFLLFRTCTGVHCCDNLWEHNWFPLGAFYKSNETLMFICLLEDAEQGCDVDDR